MIKGTIREKSKNVNMKVEELFKAVAFVFSIMLVILLPLFYITSEANASSEKKYCMYNFDLGDGYVYQIMTKESADLNSRLDEPQERANAVTNAENSFGKHIEIIDKVRTKVDTLEYATSGLMSTNMKDWRFYEYAYARGNQEYFNYDETTFAQQKMKRILFTILDMSDDLEIMDKKNEREYVKKKGRHTIGNEDEQDPSPYLSSYYWTGWKVGDWYTLGITKHQESYLDKVKNMGGFMDCTVKVDKQNLEIRRYDSSRTVTSTIKLREYLKDDLNIILLANCNSSIATKKEVKPGESINSGNFSYKINEDSVDVKNKTIDVDVFYNGPNYSVNSDGAYTYSYKNEKILTFRYTKGVNARSIPSTDYILYEDSYNYEGEAYSASTLHLVPNDYAGYANEKTKITEILPRVIGIQEYNCFDIAYDVEYKNETGLASSGAFYHKVDKNVGYLIRRNPAKDEPFDGSLSYLFYDNCIVPAAIQRQDVEIIIMNNYGHITEGFDPAKVLFESPILCHDLNNDDYVDNLHEHTSFFKADVIFKIKKETLNEIIDSKMPTVEKEDLTGVIASSGKWKLKYDEENEILTATNEGNTVQGEKKMTFDMLFNETGIYPLYSSYTNDQGVNERSFKVSLSKVENGTNINKNSTFYKHTDYENQSNSNYAAVLIAGQPLESDIDDTKTAFERLIENFSVNTSQQIFLQFYDPYASEYDRNQTRRGSSVSDTINLYDDSYGNEYFRNFMVDSSGKIISFELTGLFKEKYKAQIEDSKQEQLEAEKKKLSFQMLDAEELSENETKFYEALFRYSKPIIMFLILVVIMYTGIYSIMNSQDPKARALVKEKIKHILVGVVMFASVVLILWLCKSFMESNFAKIQEVAETNIDSTVNVVEAEIEQSWLVDIVVSFINSIRSMIEWMINTILARIAGNGASVSDPFALVFNTGTAVDHTLAPFNKTEWERYMYGYRALEALSLALLALALIKVAAEHVINAGNAEKIAESKQSILRMGIAMLCIVLGPYIVRLILTLFNYLLLLVPLKDIDLELLFGDEGIIGAIAALLFRWVIFKIYLVFVVRKLMITFMLLITPVVFGLWAVSNKFRSLSLWIGELVTNAATQICYALVFFVASLIMFNGQSDFVTLILVMMFMQLADFFKDSLQGLVQKWGGINETGIAEGMASGILNVGKQTVSTTKKVVNTAGGGLQELSKKLDSDRVTDGGRVMHNVGAIMRGDLFGLETKSQTKKNISKKYDVQKEEKKSIYRDKDARAERLGEHSPKYKEYYDEVRSGKVQYDENAEYEDPEQRAAYREASLANKAESEAIALGRGVGRAREESEDSKNFVERLQDNIKEKALEKSDKDLGNFESLQDFKDATAKIGKSFGESRDSLAKKSAALDILKELKGNKDSGNNPKDYNEQIKTTCKSAIEEISRLEASDNNSERVVNVTADIKKQIVEALEGQNLEGELKDTVETYKKDTRTADKNSPEYMEFQDKKEKRTANMRENFGLKKQEN